MNFTRTLRIITHGLKLLNRQLLKLLYVQDMARLFLSPPDMSGREREMLIAAFDSNWIAPAGPDLDAFETEFANFVGTPGAVGLSSGTAALHLALIQLDVGPGDEVVLPTVTFVATANAIAYVGASPVLIDCEASTGNIDPDLLDEFLGERSRSGRMPKAIMTVDLYGQCCDYVRILDICERYNLPIVEDAAEALGATYDGRSAGTFGAFGVFSMNGNKIITTSGGGMMVSSEPKHLERTRYLSTQARQPLPYYEHTEVGYNYRLSNLLAAVGRGQLETLPAKIERRRQIRQRYLEFSDKYEGLSMLGWDPRGEPNAWLSVMLVDAAATGVTPEEIMVRLDALDIEARHAWKPMHQQPLFQGVEIVGGSVADDLFERGLCLPSGSSMTERQQDRVLDALADLLG